jgi:hypothetical protein
VARKALNHRGTRLLISAHDVPVLFRVELGRELSGAHQITEQHGELAPLGFCHPRARLLSGLPLGLAPPLSCRALWRSLGFALCLVALLRGLGQRAATLATEASQGEILKPATRTTKLEGQPTPHTELHAFGILKPAAPTAHAASLLLQALGDKGNTEHARFDNRRLPIR